MADLITVTREWIRQLQDELGRLRRKVDSSTSSSNSSAQDDGPFPATASGQILSGEMGSIRRLVNAGETVDPTWSDSAIDGEQAYNRTGNTIDNGGAIDVYREPSKGTLVIVRGGKIDTSPPECDPCEPISVLGRLITLTGMGGETYSGSTTMSEIISQVEINCGCGICETCDFGSLIEVNLSNFPDVGTAQLNHLQLNLDVWDWNGSGLDGDYELAKLQGEEVWQLQQDVSSSFVIPPGFPAANDYHYQELTIRAECGGLSGGDVKVKLGAWIIGWENSDKTRDTHEPQAMVHVLGSPGAEISPGSIDTFEDVILTDCKKLTTNFSGFVPTAQNTGGLDPSRQWTGSYTFNDVPPPPPPDTTSAATYIHLVREPASFADFLVATWDTIDLFDTEGESQNITVTLSNGQMVMEHDAVYELTANLEIVHDSDPANRDLELRVYNYTEGDPVGEVMPFRILANTSSTMVTVSTVFRLLTSDLDEYIVVQVGNGAAVTVATLGATVYVNRIAN